ncbi:alkaline phosphatase family protein [Hyphococcus lacteus]|uniref:Alkaline phosphatase family protein n=1 Tax=Hyphococcus lacteus TaxID=3143536 RepID=A0ABV3Z0K0_9PROT
MSARNLFFGFDGSNPVLVDQMITEGELPTFKKIRDAASVHAIENDPGMGAGQFWSSASIGADPSYHGRYFYLQFNPSTYDIVPNHETELPGVAPFWHTLDDAGYKVAIVDWHRMYAKPLKNGILVDNWLGHDPLTDTQWFPPTLSEKGKKYFTGDTIGGGFAARARHSEKDFRDYLTQTFKRIEAKTDFCVDQIASNHWDLFVACYSDTHDIGHYFYFLEDENHELYDAALAERLHNPLRQTYREQDRAIARIIEQAGPDANIFVFGGPGMETLISANNALEEMLRRIDLGVEAPASTAEVAKNTYRNILPQAIRRRIAPFARKVRQRVANSEYQRRKFFSVPHNDNAGAIRINVKGREKYGIVTKGQEYDALVKEITAALATFRNPETGRAIVKKVVSIDREFDGPYRDLLPDLFVEWDRTDTARDFRKIVSDEYGEIPLKSVLRNGDHNAHGFFWMPSTAPDDTYTRPGDISAPVLDAVRTR